MRLSTRPGAVGDAAGILTVQALSWQAAYQGLLPTRAFPKADDPSGVRYWRQILLSGDTATRVAARADGAVVAFASGGWRRDPSLPADSEIYALYVHPDLQGRGLGRRLLKSLGAVFEGRGAQRLGLWVLAANEPGQRFYRRMGGTAKVRQVSRERGVDFDEVAYVWDPITALRGE